MLQNLILLLCMMPFQHTQMIILLLNLLIFKIYYNNMNENNLNSIIKDPVDTRKRGI